MGRKASNPKEAVGTRKWRQFCCVPANVIWEVGIAMLEGALKYGRHNYRVAGVRASVYVEAAKGHIDQFWEGEDIDADSRIHHISKAIASLVILRDSIMCDNWTDDRPPPPPLDALRRQMQEQVEYLLDLYPDAKPPHLAIDTVDRD